MKKKIIALLVLMAMSLSVLAGCGTTVDSETEAPAGDSVTVSPADNTNTAAAADTDTETDADTAEELLEPVMEWYELYNPNGFDTVTCAVTNPNSVAINFSCNLVFYKDGAEVSRIEGCANFDLLPGHKDIIWANWDVPSAEDADEVRMEDVYVGKAEGAIDGSYEFVGVTDGDAYFDFTFDSKPTLATIWFVLYNDENGNGMFDAGEISVVNTASLTEQTGRVSFEANVYTYTDYEVYFTAY